STTFDGLAYIASSPELIKAFGADATAGAAHYIKFGAAEGRSTTFDGLAYIASYSELIKAFGADAAAGATHYIKFGAAEGRAATFDNVAYLLSQFDLISAGFTANQASEHWIKFGYSEGRDPYGAFGLEQSKHLLTLGGSISGKIDSSGDRDWYKIELAAGKGVTFDLTASFDNSKFSIVDAHGKTLMTSGGDTNVIAFSAPTAGAYYIIVEAATASSGSYSFSVTNSYLTVGTSGNDTLTGTDGADVLQGLDGSDTLNGRGGNDVLEGGGGYDTLDGGLGDDTLYGNNAVNSGYDYNGDSLQDMEGGNDRLFGQDGSDYLYVSRFVNIAASNVLLDGGTGDDSIYFSASSRHLDTVTVQGGTGNDTIYVGSVLKSVIDAGDGGDKVTIDMTGGDQKITLGDGADVLTLADSAYSFAIGNPTHVTDFQTGTDTLNMDKYLANSLVDWDKASNPFGDGHLRLVQSGSDTLLQLDRDGSGAGYSFQTLL
ncbi:pre-peptidase C-terminal domain-containing protein, partial [Sphingomonas faeni]|uniref:calcium-binding protein n=1 Tax=Sphingomonas faeni TaxID=185950 RepID=UPI00334BB854